MHCAIIVVHVQGQLAAPPNESIQKINKTNWF